MALSVFYRALKSRITELAQQSKLILGQGIMQIDTGDRALVIPTSATASMSFLPIEDQCIFRMTLGSSQLIPATTYTKIAFDTLDFDYSSCADIAGSKFTAPSDGIYQFTCGLYSTDATSQQKQIALFKNGSAFLALSIFRNDSTTLETSNSGNISLSAGDEISIYCYFGIGQTIPLSTATFFSGARVK